MSKMYPNGGYRNKAAMELSMPLQASPPIVSSSPSAPRNNKTTTANPYNKSSVGLGVGREPPPTGRNSMTIDLRGFADHHGRDLTWQQKSAMERGNQYGSGKFSIEIDLKGSNYRVNGKGAIMRAALKLARGLVRGGRRLPKNLYKELILTIVDQILNQLSKLLDSMFPEPSTVLTVPSSSTGGVWAIDPQFAQFRGGDSIEIPGGLGGVSVAYPDIDDYPLAMGELAATSVSALPSGSTANINAWVANGKQPYTTVRDEIFTTLKDLVNHGNLSAVYRNIVIGQDSPGLFNSRHVATFRIPRGLSNGVRTDFRMRLKVNPHTFTNGFKQGGNSDGTKTKTDQRWQMPDKKFGMAPWLQRIAAGAFGATELGDLIDSFYDALPANRKYGRSYLDKLSRLHQYWDEIDWGKAISNVIWNHYEDKFVGKVMGTAGDQLRKTDIGGTNYKYGVTSGGGSTVYTGDIAF